MIIFKQKKQRGLILKTTTKIILRILVIIIFISQGTYPQVSKIFGIGFIGGLGFANVSTNVYDVYSQEQKPDLNSRLGIVAGISTLFKINKLVSFESDFLFYQKGYKTEFFFEPSNSESKSSNTINYLEVPLLIKLSVPLQKNKFIPSIYAGAYISYLLSAKSNYEYSFIGIGGSGESDFKDNLTDLDWGFAFGASIGYLVKKFEIGIDARYDLGMQNINKIEQGYIGEEVPMDIVTKNRTFYIGLYFIYNIGKSKPSLGEESQEDDDIWN